MADTDDGTVKQVPKSVSKAGKDTKENILSIHRF